MTTEALMSANKTGRNDPCPTSQMDFASMEEMQAFLNTFQSQRNQSPVDDFRGLSPNQMHRLLHFPLESPDVVRVSTVLDSEPDAPLAYLFGLLAEAIGDKGLKPTAKGNLPRNACREIMQAFLGESGYAKRTRFGGINAEHDAAELHFTRVVAELAGFVRKYRGRFILSRAARGMLATTGQRELYPQLFRTYTTQFNWAYRGGIVEMPAIIQQGWALTAYLLHLEGHQPQPATFYADAFRQAFPMIDMDLEEGPLLYRSLEDTWRRVYTLDCLEHFAAFTGIATVRKEDDDVMTPPQATSVQAMPLLSRLIQF